MSAYTGWVLNGRRRPSLDYAFSPFELGIDFTEVEFEASDGVPLAGWWMDQPGSDTVVICAHGHRGNKSDMLGIGSGLWRAGHSVFVFDFRGNGDSGDGPQSLAHHEQRDLTAALDLVARTHPEARIAVVGFSMGASTAILTAARDERVAAIVADSPFATLRDVVGAAYRKYQLPSEPLLPLADVGNRIRYGYAFSEVRPLDVVAKIAPRPFMLLHGTEDAVIPYEHALQLVEAAGDAVEFVTFEGVDHCGGYFEDRPGYIALVADFLDRWALSSRR